MNAASLRQSFSVEGAATSAYRWRNGRADSYPGLYVDRLGAYLFVHSDPEYFHGSHAYWQKMASETRAKGIYQKELQTAPRKLEKSDLTAKLVWGEAAPPLLTVRENWLNYVLKLSEGYSYGLFLDQRDNRQKLKDYCVERKREKGALSVLNTFSYTCSFSVVAAAAGAQTTSLDLNKAYLEWGKENFRGNKLDPDKHDFVFGDTRDWLKRFAKQGRQWDVIVLDPPTFSTSKKLGVFRVEKDFPALLALALKVAAPGAQLICSQNQKSLGPTAFEKLIHKGFDGSEHSLSQLKLMPKAADFPGKHGENPASTVFWAALR